MNRASKHSSGLSNSAISRVERAAFTLIELLIVVAIIAILAAIAVPNFLEAQTRSKVSRTHNDLRQLQLGLTAYMVDNQKFPSQSLFTVSGANPAARRSDMLAQREPLNGLTTPIAFLTSIPADVFSREKDGPETLRRPYYVNLTQLTGISGHAVGINKFILGSVGPDGVQELDEMVEELTFSGYAWVRYYGVYDPTNGTVSKGDIAKTACQTIGGGGLNAMY